MDSNNYTKFKMLVTIRRLELISTDEYVFMMETIWMP